MRDYFAVHCRMRNGTYFVTSFDTAGIKDFDDILVLKKVYLGVSNIPPKVQS